MAQFNYEQYAAQQAARKSSNSSANNGGNSERTEVHFFGEFMKNDGDMVVVRFPYHSMSDVTFETTHTVDYPGRKFKARVSCSGNNCPFCEQGIKIDTRVFVKGLLYVADDNGNMNRYNGVWDRPSAFADIEIKNLINEYGDLTNVLFKIRRTGSGTATRYTTSIVLPNNAIYNDTTCVADFSELNSVDASRILCKTVAQYNQALNPQANSNDSAAARSNSVPQQASQPASSAPVAQPAPYVPQQEENAVQPAAPAFAAAANYAPAAPQAPANPAEAPRQTKRYQF